MADEDLSIMEKRSQQVLKIVHEESKRWGTKNILFQPGTYDGDGKALVRPFVPVNLVGNPTQSNPVIFKNFKLHDVLFVNCCFRNNIEGAPNVRHSLRHHLRIFNVVLIENILSSCSVLNLEDLLLLRTEKQEKSSTIAGSSVVEFLREYLSTMRRLETLLPDSRKDILPEYIQFRFKISLIMCNDGIVIWFRRPIGKRRDSLKISREKSLGYVIPNLSAKKNIFPLTAGQKGIVFRNLAIVSQAFASSVYKIEGTVFKIPDDFGILEVKSGADATMENVLIGYVDKNGKPKALSLRGLWVIANDMPSLFSDVEGKERAQHDFFNRLIGSGPIKGEKLKRYTEADLAKEIDSVKETYLSLILRENAEELELQQFLEEHPFILSPAYLDVSSGSLDVTPQVRVAKGKRIVDFLLLFEPDFEDAKRLVAIIEIKRPSHKLFVKKSVPSKPLNEGLQQVEEIFRIVNAKPQEASRLGLRNSDTLSGMVLIGRRSDLKKDDFSCLEQMNKANAQTKIVTFDSLLENIETVRDFYGARGRQPVVVVGQQGTNDEDFTGKNGKTIQNAIDYFQKN